MLSVAVVDNKGQFQGVFSVSDLFCAMVKGARLILLRTTRIQHTTYTRNPP